MRGETSSRKNLTSPVVLDGTADKMSENHTDIFYFTVSKGPKKVVEQFKNVWTGLEQMSPKSQMEWMNEGKERKRNTAYRPILKLFNKRLVKQIYWLKTE